MKKYFLILLIPLILCSFAIGGVFFGSTEIPGNNVPRYAFNSLFAKYIQIYRGGTLHRVADIDSIAGAYVAKSDTTAAFANLAHRNTNNTLTGNNVFTKYVELPGAVVIKPTNGPSVGTGNAYITVPLTNPNVFNFTAPNTAGTFLDLSNTADVSRIARLSDLNARTPIVVSSNITMALNADYFNTSASSYTLTLPTTTGAATDGSKIITALVTGSGGSLIIRVPSGYSMQSGNTFATTTGTGGATLTQGTKVQLIPLVNNGYYLQVLNGSVTLY